MVARSPPRLAGLGTVAQTRRAGRGAVDSPAAVRDMGGPEGWFMSHAELARTIDAAFDNRNDVGPQTRGPVRDAVDAALDLLDRGMARVAEKGPDGTWRVNQWLKKAVLLSFRLNDMSAIPG